MAITINNGIANIDGTPGAASGVFANRPSATDVADGTLYFATDTTAIYQAVSGSWINYAGGGGGSVNSVTGTAPIASSGGANPVISISQSGAATNGFLNSTDWNTFNNKIGGSGVATRVAFWSATNAVTSNANFYWDNVNSRLSIKRSIATLFFNLDVNGNARIGNFEINTASNAVYTGVGIKVVATDTTCQFQGSPKGDIGTMFKFDTYDTTLIPITNTNAGIIKIDGGFRLPNTNNLEGNALWITPEYDFSGSLFTGTIARGIYYNPTLTSLLDTEHIAFENTSGDIIFGNLASGSTPITFVDNDGKLGNSYLINDTINQKLYSQNSGDDKGISLDFLNNVYKFGAYDYNNGTSLYINDNFNVAYFLNVVNGSAGAQGMYMEFGSNRYVFGDVSNTTNGINIEINNSLSVIFATFNNNRNGLLLNFDLLDYYLGDVNNFNSFINVNATDDKIFFVTQNGKYNFQNVPRYNDNADALTNGLIVGDIYRTPDLSGTSNILKIVV